MMGAKKCSSSKVISALIIIGAVNWGLIGLGSLIGSSSNWNVVSMILGSWPMVESIVYVLVGIAGVMAIFGGCRCKTCKV